jgi:3-oxoacyl-[acyl-carrier protein] reductase
MSKFETIQVGDKAEISHIITEKDVDKFVELTGDDNRLHIDSEFAGTTQFKKRVVHGMLGASFISTIIGTKLPGDGSLWFSQSLEFILPVRIGDEITVIAEVISKNAKEQIVELQTDIFNQNKQKVTTGKAKVKVVEPEIKETNVASAINKKALIIGASGGIGSAVALMLAENGYDVALHCNSSEGKINSLQKKISETGVKTITVKADISDETSVKEMFNTLERKFSGLTSIIYCPTPPTPSVNIKNINWSDFQKHFDVNVKGLLNVVKNILPYFEPQKYGRIVCITSQYTEGTPPSELSYYVSAKYALNGFVKSLAVELATKGITANLVSPGMTDTELIADVPEKSRLLVAAKAPLRRLASPEDVANAVLFLVSEKSSYITGETIRVNGGQVML